MHYFTNVCWPKSNTSPSFYQNWEFQHHLLIVTIILFQWQYSIPEMLGCRINRTCKVGMTVLVKLFIRSGIRTLTTMTLHAIFSVVSGTLPVCLTSSDTSNATLDLKVNFMLHWKGTCCMFIFIFNTMLLLPYHLVCLVFSEVNLVCLHILKICFGYCSFSMLTGLLIRPAVIILRPGEKQFMKWRRRTNV